MPRIDDIHALRRDLVHEFKLIRKHLKISFFLLATERKNTRGIGCDAALFRHFTPYARETSACHFFLAICLSFVWGYVIINSKSISQFTYKGEDL